MNLFACPVQTMPEAVTRRARRAFILLFVIGAGLRALASFQTISIVFPDEHQQFLEQAHRIVYGYGHHFWEQERGIRHPLYPALLAGPLAGFEAIGIRDSIIQGAALRWVVSLFALLACALFAWEFHRRGDTTTALLLMFLFALIPDVIYTHIHPLSEIGATIPFLLALVWVDRRPFVSGLLLGMAFGIRFQMGFMIAAMVFMAWIQNRGRFNWPFLKLMAGLGFAIFGLGLSDRLTFGEWFHSPLEYYQANLVEGVANQWGVEPWYQYLLWLGEGGWAIIVPIGIFVVAGVRREWALGLLAAGFILPHMLVAHKEARFLLPIAPLMLGLAAVGFSELCRRLDDRWRALAFIAVIAALAAVAVIRFPQIRWNNSPYRPTAELLHEAGKHPDLTGIAVVGLDRTECANYFFLRRDVPLIVVQETGPENLVGEPAAKNARINYLICPNIHSHKFAAYRPLAIMSSGDFTLYQLTRVVVVPDAERRAMLVGS
jgi:hypothetical protein